MSDKPFRMIMSSQCWATDDIITKNVRKSKKYPRVKYVTAEDALRLPPCAVCGGGPSLPLSLDVLRKWEGDIYGINDTSGYLSDNGIENYIYAIDPQWQILKTGPLTKGALYATRVHRRQFHFPKENIRVFDMLEDAPGGIEGGCTAVCRTPLLLLRIGYTGIYYFGCEGSFYDFTHITGTQKVALKNLIVVRAGGVDYITNAALLMQSEYLSGVISKYPQFLHNMSGGLLKAMLDYPDDWEVVAVSEDLKPHIKTTSGRDIFPNQYTFGEFPIWQQHKTSSTQPLER